MHALSRRSLRLTAPLLLIAAGAGCSSTSTSGSATSPISSTTVSGSTSSVTPTPTPSPTSSAARTNWYGADPRALAVALGATGFTPTAKDSSLPFDYQSGSALFNGVKVDIGTFATPKGQAQNAALQKSGAGSLPPGTALYYAIGTGALVTQQLGPGGLTAAVSAQSKQTAQAAVEALPGFKLVILESTQK